MQGVTFTSTEESHHVWCFMSGTLENLVGSPFPLMSYSTVVDPAIPEPLASVCGHCKFDADSLIHEPLEKQKHRLSDQILIIMLPVP